MKNTIKYLSASSLFFVAMYTQASELGEINNYNEVIQPVDKNAEFNILVSGVTSDQGFLYLPSYEDSTIDNYSVLKGQLSEKPMLTEIYGRDVLAYQFVTPNSQVEIKQTLLVEDVYKTKKAKIKYSKPAGVKKVSYEFTNTSPVTIKNYSGQLSVPQKTELYAVVTPEWSKKKKTFEIKQNGDWKVVEVKRKKVNSGSSVAYKIRTYSPSPVIKVVLWSLVILLSTALLWKRRGILSSLDDKSSAKKAIAN